MDSTTSISTPLSNITGGQDVIFLIVSNAPWSAVNHTLFERHTINGKSTDETRSEEYGK